MTLIPEAPPGFRSGFASLVGMTNVGKSTLLNRLVDQKVAIVSPKPQTTRHRIQAIRTSPASQVILVDTPGFHKPRKGLSRAMLRTAREGLRGVDLVLYMVRPMLPIGEGDRRICELLEPVTVPVILLINRIDRSGPQAALPVIEAYQQHLEFEQAVPLSALTGLNVDRLEILLDELLPPGPYYFPPGMVTDQPERFVAGEIIREKVLRRIQQEVPHSVAVLVEEMGPGTDEGWVQVRAVIVVERESQKRIVVGKGGAQLREIGRWAREDLERRLGSRVWLDLWVKVRPRWRDDPVWLRRFGLDGS